MTEIFPDKEIKQKTKVITQEFLRERTMTAFAKELGIDASPQMVFHWKTGKQAPSVETLIKVLRSPAATIEARKWARKCYVSILKFHGVVDVDQFIESKE